MSGTVNMKDLKREINALSDQINDEADAVHKGDCDEYEDGLTERGYLVQGAFAVARNTAILVPR